MYTERTTYGPFGRLSGPRPSESHLGPWPRWRNLSVEPRLTIESFPSRPPAPQRRRRSRYKSRLDLRAHIYVRIRTCRIIRDPNNSRSWNFDHNNLNNSRSLKKIFIFGIANYSNQYGTWQFTGTDTTLLEYNYSLPQVNDSVKES